MMRLRILSRWCLLFAVVTAPRGVPAAPPTPEERARATIPAIALVPRNTWWEPSEWPLQPPALEPSGLYVFRPDRPAGTRVSLSLAGNIRSVGLSPVGDLLALETTHVGDGAPRPGGPSAADFEVVVADTSGDSLTSLAGAVRLSWRSDGSELAVGIGCAPWAPVPAFDSVLVWDPRSHGVRGFHVPASRGALGWDGKDVVLVGGSITSQPTALNVRTGVVRRGKRRGTNLSPDRLYSIGPSRGALQWGIYDDATGADLAAPAVRLLRLSKVERVRVDWLAYPGEGHLACVSACTPWTGPESGPRHRTCRTGLVDVKRMRLVGWTDGRLIGPTSEGGEAFLFHEGAVRFLARGDWKAGPAPRGG